MPKVILAFDSFKGALSAAQACTAAAVGVARLSPPPAAVICPLSDGGEGFAEAMRLACHGEVRPVEVTGPLFTPTHAEMVFLDGGATAVVESAQACGLTLVPLERRSPRKTTTAGLGEMLAAAAAAGATRIIIGLGGSATNDGGMGMLTALGWQFLDSDNQPLAPVGDSLGRVARIIAGNRLEGLRLVAACDVTNPLYGPQGAASIFAPQKGASPAEVRALDRGLEHYAQVCAAMLGVDFAQHPGAGAAGGLGFALLAFLHATFQPGAELAIALTDLPSQLAGASLCLTGEGQTDFQTAYGKLPTAVAACCAQVGVPCVCLSGALGQGWYELYHHNFTALFSIAERPQSLDDAIAHTADALADSAEAVTRLGLSHTRQKQTGTG